MKNQSKKYDKLLVQLIFMLALSCIPPALWAATCTVDTPGVAFGSYDVFNTSDLDGVGNIDVNCDVSAAYTIMLSSGNGSFAARIMSNGPHQLQYNLYSDLARMTIWGDGTGGTVIVSNTAVTANHAVYGRIPARQNPSIGSYSDHITVTLTF